MLLGQTVVRRLTGNVCFSLEKKNVSDENGSYSSDEMVRTQDSEKDCSQPTSTPTTTRSSARTKDRENRPNYKESSSNDDYESSDNNYESSDNN